VAPRFVIDGESRNKEIHVMRRALVAGNWKMNGSRESISQLMAELKSGLSAGVNGVDIVVCPPFPYLQLVAEAARGAEIILGAQTVSSEDNGAFTGEVSAAMLRDFRVRYVLVGHSERRQMFGESDVEVARKFAAVAQAGMIPVLCVGETLAQRDDGSAEQVVSRQLESVLSMHGVAAMEGAVIAYEPVWAIGTGRSASCAQAQAMHKCIRAVLSAHDGGVAETTQIVYGGSVTAENAEELFACEDIDGGLVGGASLSAATFIQICNSVS